MPTPVFMMPMNNVGEENADTRSGRPADPWVRRAKAPRASGCVIGFDLDASFKWPPRVGPFGEHRVA